jgi:hypothetical protein
MSHKSTEFGFEKQVNLLLFSQTLELAKRSPPHKNGQRIERMERMKDQRFGGQGRLHSWQHQLTMDGSG